MSKNLPGNAFHPSPGWATLQDPISSDEEVQAVGDSRGALSAQVKKRKGGGDRGVMGREGAGTSTKRPRHSFSSVKLSETNKRSAKSGLPGLGASGSSDMDIGSGASAAKLSAAPPSTKSAQSAGPGLLGASSIRSKPPQEGVSKSVRSPPQPGPSVASSSTGRRGSTASNLAALWPSSAPRAAGPSIQKWGEHHDDRTHPKERYMQLKEEVDKFKGKGKEKEKTSVTPEYLGDLSDESVSSSIGPIRNTGVGSLSRSVAGPSQNVASAFTSTSRRTLVGKTLARSADTREERGPLYVNERRQVARKTIGSSKPSKRFHFDRPAVSISDHKTSEIDSSSSVDTSESSRVPLGKDKDMEDSIDVPKPPTIRHTARKSNAWAAPVRPVSAQGLSKGKEKEKLARRFSEHDVIVIESSESSDDENPPTKSSSTASPLRQNRKSFSREVPGPSSLKTVKEKGKGKHKKSASGGNMELIAALNKAYTKQDARKQEAKTKTKPASTSKPSLEQDIIDLTIDDSDEMSARPPKPGPKSPTTAGMKKKKLSFSRPVLGRQSSDGVQASPPPITPLIAPIPVKESRSRTVTNLIAGLPKEELTPRPRSVPMVYSSLASRKTLLARTPLLLSPAIAPKKRLAFPTHPRSISEDEVEDSEGAVEELEEVQAMIEDTGASSSKEDVNALGSIIPPLPTTSSSSVSSARASPDLIPPVRPVRRSLRHSSGSLHSEPDNILPYTDVESPPESSPSPGPDDMNEPPSYGGFKALTWEHHKKDLNNFHLKHYSAKDIPTSLPDSINGLSEYTRSNRGMQDIFRAFILESVAEDETGAPDIEIVNEVDTEPTPLFEFKYSNRMWYGEGVPPPDYNKLKGCECVGGCDPRSKKCACAVRQREYLGMEDGCVYDKNGRLKHPRYPILECNEMCACDDDCRNRVVQHGRKCQVNLKKTPNKGWGVFNGPRRIPKGTFIGIYAGELLTDEQGEQRGTYYNKIGKTYLFDIDFWHLRIDENSDDWHNKYTVDAFHAGNFTRFLNHSCDPNARLQACYINEPDIEKPLLVVFSTRDIDPHQEICFSYTGNYPEDGPDEEEEVQKEKREDPVYIECKCGAWNCTGKMWN